MPTKCPSRQSLEGDTLQLFFRLVRPADIGHLSQHLDCLLSRLRGAEHENIACLVRLYKLIGQTRDIIYGKGERQLAIAQIWVWYRHYPYLAVTALHLLVFSPTYKHPLGSWKDLKHFCEYVRQKSGLEDHPLIFHALAMAKYQLDYDWGTFRAREEGRTTSPLRCSLFARWFPREKSKPFGWIFRKFARLYFPGLFATAKRRGSLRRATKKARAQLRKRLTALSESTGTVEIKMSTGRWGQIDYARVPSQALHRYRLAFSNLTHQGAQRSRSADRIRGAANYCRYLAATDIRSVSAARCSVGQLVKAALSATVAVDIRLVNAQWEANRLKSQATRRHILAMLDTSVDIEWSACAYYTAIGLAVRASEISEPPFKDKLLTFGNPPRWISLEGCTTLTQKVKKIVGTRRTVGRAFAGALRLLVEAVPPGSRQASRLTVVVISDMESDETPAIFASSFRLPPTWPPRTVPCGPALVCWNLCGGQKLRTEGSARQLTLLSGHNCSLLNLLHAATRVGCTPVSPLSRLDGLLRHPRYALFEAAINGYFLQDKYISKVNKNTGVK